MTPEQQTLAALGIVVLTAALFAWRLCRRKKRPGCGGGCACTAPRKPGAP